MYEFNDEVLIRSGMFITVWSGSGLIGKSTPSDLYWNQDVFDSSVSTQSHVFLINPNGETTDVWQVGYSDKRECLVM